MSSLTVDIHAPPGGYRVKGQKKAELNPKWISKLSKCNLEGAKAKRTKANSDWVLQDDNGAYAQLQLEESSGAFSFL